MKSKFVKESLNESDLDWFEGDKEDGGNAYDPKDRQGLVMELTELFSEAAGVGFEFEELQEVINEALNEVDWEEANSYRERHAKHDNVDDSTLTDTEKLDKKYPYPR